MTGISPIDCILSYQANGFLPNKPGARLRPTEHEKRARQRMIDDFNRRHRVTPLKPLAPEQPVLVKNTEGPGYKDGYKVIEQSGNKVFVEAEASGKFFVPDRRFVAQKGVEGEDMVCAGSGGADGLPVSDGPQLDEVPTAAATTISDIGTRQTSPEKPQSPTVPRRSARIVRKPVKLDL